MSDELRTVKRKRGVLRGQITRIRTRLTQLSAKTDEPQTVSHARRMANKLEELDVEFKSHHYALVELIKSDKDLAREQAILDEHENEFADLVIQVEELISSCNPSSDAVSNENRSILCRKLAHLKNQVDSVGRAMDSETIERYVIEQYQDELSDHIREIAKIRSELLMLHIDGDELCEQQSHLEHGIL